MKLKMKRKCSKTYKYIWTYMYIYIDIYMRTLINLACHHLRFSRILTNLVDACHISLYSSLVSYNLFMFFLTFVTKIHILSIVDCHVTVVRRHPVSFTFPAGALLASELDGFCWCGTCSRHGNFGPQTYFDKIIADGCTTMRCRVRKEDHATPLGLDTL